MQIRPNKTLLEGRIKRVDHAADGFGADIEFEVETAQAAEGYADFVGAAPGSVLTIFAADPEALRAGGAYQVTATVLGGPDGERVVLENAQDRTG
jgi:hypothetical protein